MILQFTYVINALSQQNQMIEINSPRILCEHRICVSRFKENLTFLLKDFVDATNY